jgi:hypothetical protein
MDLFVPRIEKETNILLVEKRNIKKRAQRKESKE